MPVTAPPTITALPNPPDPNNRATFNTLAYPWSVAQQTLATEVGAVADNVYDNALEAQTFATTATTKASEANASAISAMAAQAAAEAVVATIPEGTIDDGAPGATKVWSSSKVSTELATKQATLVSGTNIKTLNGNSLLGSGDLTISSGAGLVYLGVVTGTNVASLDIEGFTTTWTAYDHFVVVGTDIIGQADQDMWLRFKTGGTWQTASYLYSSTTRLFTGAPTDAQSSAASAIVLGNVINGGTNIDFSQQMFLHIYRPKEMDFVRWELMGYNSAVAVRAVEGFGLRTQIAMEGIRLMLASGNITGQLRVYGIAKS